MKRYVSLRPMSLGKPSGLTALFNDYDSINHY